MKRVKLPTLFILMLGFITFADAGDSISGSKRIGFLSFDSYNCSANETGQVMRELSIILRKNGVNIIDDYAIRQARRESGIEVAKLASSSSIGKLATKIHATGFIKGTLSLITDSNTYILSITIFNKQGGRKKNIVLNSTGNSFREFLNSTVKQMGQRMIPYL